MEINIKQAAGLLLDHDNILILSHRKPDGDTLGCGFGLLHALLAAGKKARVECADPFPAKYHYFLGEDGQYIPAEFEPEFIVAVDVASTSLLGALESVYTSIDLCIDHHKSNELFAKATLLDANSASCAEVIYHLLVEMGVKIGTISANALYTGISTDTGCFKFRNTTASTHRTAAELIQLGADNAAINKAMFDTKSRGRVQVEMLAIQSMTFAFDGKCAVITLPADVAEKHNVSEDDLDGISALPRQIDGVLAGLTIRARADGTYRISFRCDQPVDASAIASEFGGGGHKGAAGCTMTGALEDVQALLLGAVERSFQENGLC